MNVKDNHIEDELKEMIQEVEQISEDLSSYFQYHQRRQPLLESLLSESSLN